MAMLNNQRVTDLTIKMKIRYDLASSNKTWQRKISLKWRS